MGCTGRPCAVQDQATNRQSSQYPRCPVPLPSPAPTELCSNQETARDINKRLGCVSLPHLVGVGVCIFLGCPDPRRMPTIDIQLNGKNFPLAPQQYILTQTLPFSVPLTICISGISGMPLPRSLGVILGDVFMRAYYTVFDYGHKRVGLAPSRSKKCEDEA